MRPGAAFAGTMVWGYNDSPPSLYLLYGGFLVLVGAVFGFCSIRLALVASSRAGRLGTGGVTGGRDARLALGLTLTLVALSLVGFATAVNLATVDPTASAGIVSRVTLFSFAGFVALGATSGAILRGVGRRDGR